MSNASNKTYVVGCCQYVGHTTSLENCDWCEVFMNIIVFEPFHCCSDFLIFFCRSVFFVYLITLSFPLFLFCHRPFHIAAKSGLVKVVVELLNRGADLNSRDNEGGSTDC